MRYRNKVIPWLALFGWLAGVVCVFGYFELKDQRSFESTRTALFDASERATSAETWLRIHDREAATAASAVKATVVHVYNADCPCNRFTNPHLAEIVARYRSDGVRFVAASAQSATTKASAAAGGLKPIGAAIEDELTWIDATPAALVYDGNGKLIYFGPYSDAAACGSSSGLVERVLDRALRGESQRPQKFYGGGCFCSSKRST